MKNPENKMPSTPAPSPSPPTAPTVIPSQVLLGDQNWVTIEHQGHLYRLQATRQGKLILTK